jgi:hypothetical protein
MCYLHRDILKLMLLIVISWIFLFLWIVTVSGLCKKIKRRNTRKQLCLTPYCISKIIKLYCVDFRYSISEDLCASVNELTVKIKNLKNLT